MATAKQCEALALIATSGGSLAYERPREKVLINGNVVKRLEREHWIETSSVIGGKPKARSYAGLRITRTATLTASGRAALVQKCGRSDFAGARQGRRRWLRLGSSFSFRNPENMADAKAQLQRSQRNLKKARAERNDAARSHYSVGVKMADDRIAEMESAVSHFQRWIAAR